MNYDINILKKNIDEKERLHIMIENEDKLSHNNLKILGILKIFISLKIFT